jgi:hypothetical protein
MQGHFEIENSNYPISAMRVGENYKVTDMRSLKPLHSQPVSKELAYKAAALVNCKIRSKQLPGEQDSADVQDFVEAYIDERIGE